MHQGYRDIAAKQGLAGIAQAREERVAQRFHASNGGGAEQKTQEKDAKAFQPATQLSPRQAPGQCHACHAGTLPRAISSRTMCPLSSRTMRWQRRARLSS